MKRHGIKLSIGMQLTSPRTDCPAMRVTGIFPRSLGGDSCGETAELSALVQVDLDSEDTTLLTLQEVWELGYEPALR